VDDKAGAYRHILKFTAILGGTTLAGILIGLVKMKLVATLLGPAGVGLIGLLLTFVSFGSAIAGLGLQTSGVGQIAGASEDRRAQEIARRALWTLSIGMSFVGGAALWALRRPLSVLVTGDPSYAATIGWTAIAVSLAIIGSAQSASVQGYRRMGDVARMQLISNLLAAVCGVAAIHALPATTGFILFVLATPFMACLVGAIFVRRLPRLRTGPVSIATLIPVWRALAGLGIAIALTAILGSLTQILVRAIVIRGMSLEAAGLFQAAYSVSAVNLGIILAAMAADYYPRLVSAGDDHARMGALVNQQLHIALGLGAPVLACLSFMAPLALTLLYSSAFSEAAGLLRWLVAADALRLVGWALGFLMLARRAKIGYFLTEASFGLVFVPACYLLVPKVGLAAVGFGYFLAYATCLAVAMFVSHRKLGLRLDRANVRKALLTVLLLCGVAGYSYFDATGGMVLGALVTLLLTSKSWSELKAMGILPASPRDALAALRRSRSAAARSEEAP
jgi:PST family polysaccharide transporter